MFTIGLPLQIHGLKYFHDACRFRSMTEAASFNRVSRPAISQAIKSLEVDLGVPLLHHKKRGFELTAAGQRVHHLAASVFDSIDLLRAAACGQTETDLTGRLSIGVARVLSTYRFDDALSSLKKDHPKIAVRLSLHSSEAILDQLVSRELDLAVIISDEMRDGLTSEVLHEGEFVLTRPKSMRADRATYALSERRPETDAARRAFASRYGRELPVFAEVPSWDTIWNWIRRGRCGGLVPDLFFNRSGARPASCATVIESVHPYRICSYVRESQRQNPLVAAMIERLRDRFKQPYSRERPS